MDRVGKTILHYKIIEKLGMGVVYKAQDTKLMEDLKRRDTKNKET